MKNQELLNIIALTQQAVEFSPRYGALCPVCQKKMPIHTSKKWEDNAKIRYHYCTNQECIVAKSNFSIKSIQIEKRKGK